MENLRARELNELGRRIRSGSYRIDPLAVADAILRHGEMAEHARRVRRRRAVGEAAADQRPATAA